MDLDSRIVGLLVPASRNPSAAGVVVGMDDDDTGEDRLGRPQDQLGSAIFGQIIWLRWDEGSAVRMAALVPSPGTPGEG